MICVSLPQKSLTQHANPLFSLLSSPLSSLPCFRIHLIIIPLAVSLVPPRPTASTTLCMTGHTTIQWVFFRSFRTQTGSGIVQALMRQLMPSSRPWLLYICHSWDAHLDGHAHHHDSQPAEGTTPPSYHFSLSAKNVPCDKESPEVAAEFLKNAPFLQYSYSTTSTTVKQCRTARTPPQGDVWDGNPPSARCQKQKKLTSLPRRRKIVSHRNLPAVHVAQNFQIVR
jgi:hypothetical protein